MVDAETTRKVDSALQNPGFMIGRCCFQTLPCEVEGL